MKATIAYQHRQNDGYVDNSLVGSDRDHGASKGDAIWFKAKGEWNDFRAVLSADYSHLEAYPLFTQGVAASNNLQNFLANSRTLDGKVYQIRDGYVSRTSIDAAPYLQKITTRGVSLTLEYDINSALTIKSITAARGFRFEGGTPVGPNGLVGLFLSNGQIVTQAAPSLSTVDPRQQRHSQFSQEVQLLREFDQFTVVGGGFYFEESAKDQSVSRVIIAQPGYATLAMNRTEYSIRNKSYAAFGQATWKPHFAGGKLELALGLRYTEDKKRADQLLPTARQGALNSGNTSVLGSVSYQWTPDAMTYLRYTTAYRSGGFNTRATGATPFVYLPETAKSYELGFKLDLFDRHVRLNGAMFQTDNKDLQVSQFSSLQQPIER